MFTAIVNGNVAIPNEDFLYTDFIDPNVCDRFIDWYERDSDKYFLKGPGESLKDSGGVIDPTIKESIDTPVMNMVLIEPVNALVDEVDRIMGDYVKKFPFCAKGGAFHMDPGWNIQWYPPGGGYKEWHTERLSSCRVDVYRHLVWMVYLNDVPNGGTEWFHQNKYVEAEKGKCCIWPADWTWTHKGRVSETHDKLLATGWYSFA